MPGGNNSIYVNFDVGIIDINQQNNDISACKTEDLGRTDNLVKPSVVYFFSPCHATPTHINYFGNSASYYYWEQEGLS